ncbi:MAG: YbjN domain-containing protein [Nevskia sp.]|nr:YbjN domain-containing protein [Nevskia sp.]
MRVKSLILCATLALGAAQAAQAADAALLDGNSVDDILNLARGYGSATAGTQDSGAPKVYGKIEGQPYTIYFSSCDDKTHKDCQDLDLYAGYLGVKPTLDKINGWNRDTRFARAYLDSDGDAGIDMDVNLEHGVGADNLDSTLSLWSQLVKKFTAYVNAK